jgi:hypothetical protein
MEIVIRNVTHEPIKFHYMPDGHYWARLRDSKDSVAEVSAIVLHTGSEPPVRALAGWLQPIGISSGICDPGLPSLPFPADCHAVLGGWEGQSGCAGFAEKSKKLLFAACVGRLL